MNKSTIAHQFFKYLVTLHDKINLRYKGYEEF